MARTPAHQTSHEIDPIKGSRFIATVAPAGDEPSARAFIQRVIEQMPDASHHAWALRLLRPALERTFDDGEPSGSAGRPILAAMSGREIVGCGVVVTRYFGGTKLGVGGLVRAYGGAAAAALDHAELVPWVDTEQWTIEHDYRDGPAVERTLGAAMVEVVETRYEQTVQRDLLVPSTVAETVAQALLDATAGRIHLTRP